MVDLDFDINLKDDEQDVVHVKKKINGYELLQTGDKTYNLVVKGEEVLDIFEIKLVPIDRSKIVSPFLDECEYDLVTKYLHSKDIQGNTFISKVDTSENGITKYNLPTVNNCIMEDSGKDVTILNHTMGVKFPQEIRKSPFLYTKTISAGTRDNKEHIMFFFGPFHFRFMVDNGELKLTGGRGEK